MATKVANGTTTLPVNGGRPVFRRQGSSVGGAHQMTVALTPVPKVDYSVTKGGARTWAVLLVFMILCSSMYTIFSAKEMPVDFDGDGHDDYDDDMAEETTTHHKKHRDPIHVSNEDHRSHVDRTPTHEHHSHTMEAEPTADDEEDDTDDNMENQLFAGLRKKIESNFKKVKKLVQVKQQDKEEAAEDDDDDEEEEKPQRRQRRSRQKRRHQKESNEDEDDDHDDKEEDQKPPQKQLKKLKKERVQRKVVEEEEEKDDDDDDDDKDDKDDDDDDNDDKEDEVVEHNKDDDKEDDDDDDKEDDKKDDDDDDDDDDDVVPQRPVKRRHTGHITSNAPERECRRKHCPPVNTAEPRKTLLKKRKHHRHPPVVQNFAADLDDEDEDEDDDDDDDDSEEKEEEVVPEPIHEMVAVKKYRSSGREAYKRHAITNKNDHRHRDDLDKADFLVEKHDFRLAFALFDSIIRQDPHSPRAHFGKARAYDIQAEYSSDEKLFDKAIEEYELVVDNEDSPEALFRQAASRLIERSRFRGQLHRCLQTQRALIDRFPEEIKLQTDFGQTFLMMKRHDDARKVFKDILEVDPNNAIALAYYGYILKVADHDIEGGVSYMRKGLRLGGDELADPKFFYHLGHGLMYLGRDAEAYAVYEQGAELGIFLSAQQRSMHNIEGLTGRPWWSMEQTTYTKHLKVLERQWVSIRHEAVRALIDYPDMWKKENDALTTDGQWLSFDIIKNEELSGSNCDKIPLTCGLMKDFKDNSNGLKNNIRFSVLSSGAQVLPHCGPSNTLLQAHMGLVVPSEARIRVGSEQRGWKTGKFIIFDDSFEHEMQFDGASSSAFRLVLVLELWHPEVDPRQRAEYDDI